MSEKKARLARQQAQMQGGGGGVRAMIAQSQTNIRSAPLPDPAELARYKELDPDLYEKIKIDFEKNGEHRRQMEREFSTTQQTLIRGVTRNDTLGIVLSWSFAVLSIGGAYYFMSKGQEIASLIAILGVLPGVIGAMRRRR